LPRHLRRLECWLIRKFPLRRSHEVHCRPMRRNAGWHQIQDGVSVIVVDSSLPDYAQQWVLIHEWAHARERAGHKGKHHGKRWGREHWPIWSAWYDE
jgi:hypothetical protein